MRPEQWQSFKTAAKQRSSERVPLALIVDSPWMPGYLGISHLDYYLQPDVWFESNLRIAHEFPEVILFPSWWVEYGMAIEPSALGTRFHFYPDRTPDVIPSLFRAEDVDRLSPVNPRTDGFMPLALHLYRTQKQRIFDAGFTIPMVAARGPLCTAAFVRGVNDFMLDLSENAEAAHRLLRLTTDTVIGWLKAQAEVIGESVEGIFVLDDIAGFLSRRMYQQFAHPYLKEICDAFPKDWVKVYHNDANVKPFLPDLPDTGFDVLNFSHNLDIAEARERTGGRMCLMGNVNPLEVGVRGSTEEVRAASLEVLRKMKGTGMVLSVGGGVSPGMPGGNIRAMISAVREFEDQLPNTGTGFPLSSS
jgi:uroporphyrinogen-III decarboxylase